MILLDLFSGIGGFHKGLEKAGFEFDEVYFSEIDQHAIANYKHNFKNAKYAGSIKTIRGADIPRPNIITFGSPCQDFSLAGKRQGMDGQRSSLVAEAIRLIDECRPDLFIWENVKGAFSSNAGEDFWSIIKAFTDLGGYRLEWQLLNSSWVLPQNRERIYLIGHLAGASEPTVFPIGENDPIFNKAIKSKTPQSQTEISTAIRTGSLKADDTYVSVPKKAGCLTAGGNSGGLHSDMTVIVHNTMPRSSKTGKGGTGHLSKTDGKSYCLDTGNTNAIEIKIKQLNTDKKFGNQPSQQDRFYDTNGLMACLSSNRGDDKTKILINEVAIRRLTEIECERLQGFEDNHTKFGDYNGIIKPLAKTQRYKLIGNAVTVAIVELIGKKLKSSFKNSLQNE